MRHLPLLLLAASCQPAAADTRKNWSSTYVEITESETHAFDVTFHNTMIYLGKPCPANESVVLSVPEGEFLISISMDCGLSPDVMTVIPPIGYVAIPSQITVEEHDIGVIEIHQEPLG